MPARSTPLGVALPDGHTGSSFLHFLLLDASATFPEVLGGAALSPSASVFKKRFANDLVRFEAARAASDQRVAIARHMRAQAEAAMRLIEADGAIPLTQAVAQDRPAPALVVHQTEGPGRLRPAISLGEEWVGGERLIDWLREARDHHHLTGAAHERLVGLIARTRAEGGGIDLKGQRFALMGAGAELAPTAMLLAAGADVLWIDVKAPPSELLQAPDLGGRLFVPPEPSDLLADPASVVAAIRAFAQGEPVHLGMYAYAGGEGQEWRLTASMNAIAGVLGPALVASIALLISPTTAITAVAEDSAAAAERRDRASLWKRALRRVGPLRDGGSACADGRVGSVIVPLQGASYQAAQYVGKVLAAESFAVHGPTGDGETPTVVSANVAPITNTRSLVHPLFQAGFLGAPMWDVLISPSPLTRTLNGLLMIADLTDPLREQALAGLSAAERARAVLSEQIHGGVFAQPYGMYGEIQVAAVIGLLRRPSLLLALARGR